MSAGTLTLGTHLTVQQDGGGYASLNDAYNNGSIVNLGIISANISGSVFYISGNSFTNKGTIDVGDQDAVVIRSNNFTNLSGNTLTSGSYFVSAASVLELGNNAAIGTLNAKISLTGKGSFIQSYNPTTRLETTLETTLSSIAVSGVLSLLGGRGYSTTMTVKDSGQIVLNGGTFVSAGTLTVGSTGTLLGYGLVKSAVSNGGLLYAQGGTLALTGTFSGAGGRRADGARSCN